MKTCIITILVMLCSIIIRAQDYSVEDIFDQTKENSLVLKPKIEQQIRTKIKQLVDAEVNDLVKNPKNKFAVLNKKGIEYVTDTITIREFQNEYEKYNAASTVFGMNFGLKFYNESYDKLLNKYYKKSLEILKPDMKKQLMSSQKKWLEYYNNDKIFNNNLQNFGTQDFVIYASVYIDKILKDRVQFLFDIYHEEMQGTSTYIQE